MKLRYRILLLVLCILLSEGIFAFVSQTLEPHYRTSLAVASVNGDEIANMGVRAFDQFLAKVRFATILLYIGMTVFIFTFGQNESGTEKKHTA